VSSALAIAGVTQVIRDLLNDRIVDGNVAGVIGSSVTVSTMPPDKVVSDNGVEATQLNVFLRHVTPNLGWRNEGLPSRDSSGLARLSNPPLALDLHYLISAYGSQDLHAEILLGYAMQMLHEHPFITRAEIRSSLEPPPDVGATLPEALQALAETGLADQVEQLRITPEFLSTEEMSKFWTSTLTHYRPSAAYQVSVVLIQARNPAPLPLPVLERKIRALPTLTAWAPTLTSIEPSAKQPTVQIDKLVTLHGQALGGSAHEVQLFNDKFKVEEPLTPESVRGDKLEFRIPAARAADFPIGVYRVAASVLPAGESEPRRTNNLALTLAPTFVGPQQPVPRAGDGSASFSLTVTPALRTGQLARLVLGASEFAPQSFADGATTLNFTIANAPVGDHLARLRVDGVDSPVIDAEAKPPAFVTYRLRIT
jgi:uncharacterized protein DUF4255